MGASSATAAMHCHHALPTCMHRDALELLPWDYEDFRMHHLQSYVASTAEFMNELAAGEARS